MTLDQTWTNCLRMWKWIDKVWKPGMSVVVLKKEWLEKWMPAANINSDCFFCEYDVQNGLESCNCCPGRLVNLRFTCDRKTYNYFKHPKKFYQKLLQLDARRRNR